MPDGLPDTKPDTLLDWLTHLRLQQYHTLLTQQNYVELSDIMEVAWEDLEDVGITRLGMFKKINIHRQLE